jgi:hypothetical protein
MAMIMAAHREINLGMDSKLLMAAIQPGSVPLHPAIHGGSKIPAAHRC